MSLINAREITLNEAAVLTGGTVVGDGTLKVCGIAAPEYYQEGCLAPLWEKKYRPLATAEKLLFTVKGWIPEGGSGIEVEEPRTALIKLLACFDKEPKAVPGISEKAEVAESAVLGKNISIYSGAVVKENAVIGDNTVVMENAVIGCGAQLGKNCVIEPGAVIYHHCLLGDNCVIHSNAAIGCDGFGFLPDPKAGMVKIPQIGIVRLDNGVEIGASTSVDRATFGETYIGLCTKIDSHVKIGHNCHIGAYTIIVAQAGIAGSSKIGSRVILAAQSGVANHSEVGDGCTVGGRAGVVNDIPDGQTVSGFPAQEHRKELRLQAAVRQLPETLKKLKTALRESGRSEGTDSDENSEK